MDFQSTVTTHTHQLLVQLQLLGSYRSSSRHLEAEGLVLFLLPLLMVLIHAAQAHPAPQCSNSEMLLPPTTTHCLVKASCVVCGPELGRATSQGPQLHFQFTSL